MKPTMFIALGAEWIHVASVFRLGVFGATTVESLVTDDREADIALTDSVETALRMTKESEGTRIVLVHLGRQKRAEAEAFAARYPSRVTAMPYVGNEGETEIVPYLRALTASLTKERLAKPTD